MAEPNKRPGRSSSHLPARPGREPAPSAIPRRCTQPSQVPCQVVTTACRPSCRSAAGRLRLDCRQVASPSRHVAWEVGRYGALIQAVHQSRAPGEAGPFAGLVIHNRRADLRIQRRRVQQPGAATAAAVASAAARSDTSYTGTTSSFGWTVQQQVRPGTVMTRRLAGLRGVNCHTGTSAVAAECVRGLKMPGPGLPTVGRACMPGTTIRFGARLDNNAGRPFNLKGQGLTCSFCV